MIILGRFPTDKAYGITTSNTLESLDNLGFSTLCLSYPDFKNHKSDYHVINFKENWLARKLRTQAYLGFKYFNTIYWKISLQITIMNNNSTMKSVDPDVLWIRDGILLRSRFIKRSENKIVLEIHHSLTRSLIAQIRSIDPSRLVLAPISSIILNEIESSLIRNYKSVLSPMGIQKESFSKYSFVGNDRESKSEKPIILGYFGKLNPIGHSKGIEDILSLALHHEQTKFSSQFKIVGVQENEVAHLKTAITNLNLDLGKFDIISHKEHNEAVQIMFQCDILVLPEQKDKNYAGSPIKGIEYAATGKPIIAARSRANVSLFSGEFQPFWYNPQDVLSMQKSLARAMSTVNSKQYFNESRKFAFGRTWMERTRRIIGALNIATPTIRRGPSEYKE